MAARYDPYRLPLGPDRLCLDRFGRDAAAGGGHRRLRSEPRHRRGRGDAGRPCSKPPLHRQWLAVAAAAAMLPIIWAAGSLRLETGQTGGVPGVRLRIVQPDIPQTDKWSTDKQEEHFGRLLRLSATPANEPLTVIIWPETAVPFAPDLDSTQRERIAAVAPPGGLVITGAPRIAGQAGGRPKFWNSVFVIDASAGVVATYDKFHLVPFGEYMPLRKYLLFDAIAAGPNDFSAGLARRRSSCRGCRRSARSSVTRRFFPARW
jgi:apolipoprotein N-acyltransferase